MALPLLDPNKSVTLVKTFKEYSLFVFVYIIHKLKEIARIDVVWDIYKEDSLKIQTRHDREGVLIYVLIKLYQNSIKLVEFSSL